MTIFRLRAFKNTPEWFNITLMLHKTGRGVRRKSGGAQPVRGRFLQNCKTDSGVSSEERP